MRVCMSEPLPADRRDHTSRPFEGDGGVSLRQYLERLIAEHDRRYQERFDAQEQALKVALAAHNRVVVVVGAVLGALQLVLHVVH